MSTLKVQMPETAEDITSLRPEQRKRQGSYVRLGRAKDPTVDLTLQDQRAVKARPVKEKPAGSSPKSRKGECIRPRVS
jgi:hypothetical protein